MGDIFTAPMDFEGQRLAERISQYLLIGSAALGLVAGFVMQQLSITFGTFGVGVFLTSVLCIPSWGMYRKHPIAWAKPSPSSSAAAATDSKSRAATSTGDSKARGVASS
ncbi:hypothetical protein RI367_001238 [Sorochytrium milnesiophthora]